MSGGDMPALAGVACVPGQRLCACDANIRCGAGTYQKSGNLYASLVGQCMLTDEPGGVKIVSVTRGIQHGSGVVPSKGSVVTTKVVSVAPRFAKVEILCVGDQVLPNTFSGMIRVQDTRATEKDKCEMYKSFRPGDIVRAEVISLGDSRSYYLSTTRNELGVVCARSDEGVTMIPISWREMQCPKSKAVEFRKVAQVQT